MIDASDAGKTEVDMGVTDAELVNSPSASAVDNSNNLCRGAVEIEGTNNDRFPAGLRVLVVDDDPICLFILDKMLRRCLYKVTTCGKATTALEMLRENKDKFDLVISDVYMPDMDGFKLLELVGLEMDLPVIMMSANGETSAVMKGITHGACDYLLKPVRIEELRNIWQHVVRKKRKESELSGSYDENYKRFIDDGDHNSSANDGPDVNWKHSKKRKDVKEEEDDLDHDSEDPSSTKKPRVVWSVELHQQFVGAVNQLGIDKAVPKRILELMNVEGLTRENVASHLQKYRLYLKRISGVTDQQGNLNSSFPGAPDLTFDAVNDSGLGGLGDLRALAASGQLSPQALVSTLQAGLLGRLGAHGNLGVAGVDPSLFLQWAAMQGGNVGPLVRPPYGQTQLSNSQGNLQQSISRRSDLKQLVLGPPQMGFFGNQLGVPTDKGPAGMPALQQQLTATATGLGCSGQHTGITSNMSANSNNNSLMMQMIQQHGSPQLTDSGTLNLPSSGLWSQHMLSNDIGGTRSMAPLSPVSGINTTKCSRVVPTIGQVRPVVGSSLGLSNSSSANVLGPQGRTLCVDNKSLHFPGAGTGSICVPISFSVSSPLRSTGLEGDTGLKGLGSTFVGTSEDLGQTAKATSPNFSSLMGLSRRPKLNIGSNIRQGWQGLNLSHDLVQASSTVLSPGYSQASSSSPGFNVGNGHEQGQRRSSDFVSQNLGFIGCLAVKDGRLKAPVTVIQSHSVQSTADSEPKAKDGTLGLLTGLKTENMLLPENFTSSDDLLSIILKQQQEGLVFSEGDLAADSYNALDNMYVK